MWPTGGAFVPINLVGKRKETRSLGVEGGDKQRKQPGMGIENESRKEKYKTCHLA